MDDFTKIPIKYIGPVSFFLKDFLSTETKNITTNIPLATLETPLWYSIKRGIKVINSIGNLKVVVDYKGMSRSILLKGKDIFNNQKFINNLDDIAKKHFNKLAQQTSNHINYKSYYVNNVGNLLFLRLSFNCNAASGHNMATIAAENIMKFLVKNYKFTEISLSANICCDKKNSAINFILGRSYNLNVEGYIDQTICKTILNINNIEEFCSLIKNKNMLGSIIGGSICSANAHFANIISDIYLATGQDIANLVESSQGISIAEKENNQLYFSCKLPSIIVGSYGNGKDSDYVKNSINNLTYNNKEKLNLQDIAIRIVAVIGVATWAGELSLLAALNQNNVLTRSHNILERRKY